MKPLSTGFPPRIELAEFSKLSDPYPLYQELREVSRICRMGGNQWLVTRHQDVIKNLRNPNLKQFQIAGILNQFPQNALLQSIRDDPATRFTECILAGRDGSSHSELRSRMARALKMSFAELEQNLPRELDKIFANLRERREFNAVSDLAHTVAICTLSRIIGLPNVLQNEVATLSLRLAHVFSPQFIDSERTSVNNAVTRLREIIGEVVQAKSCSGSFAQRFCKIASPDYSKQEIIDNIVFVLFAGYETSLNLLSNGIAALLAYPDQFFRLQQAPDLIDTAIDEFLRFDSPVHMTGRIVDEPETIAGQRIGRGRIVYLAIASANRDPSVFLKPNRLNIARDPCPHVAFGAGEHLCLGLHIARREARHVFLRMVRDFSSIEASGAPTRKISATFRTLKELPVRLKK